MGYIWYRTKVELAEITDSVLIRFACVPEINHKHLHRNFEGGDAYSPLIDSREVASFLGCPTAPLALPVPA